MKGIILAGGTGSRLFPLTKITNKHLLPVSHYPMIYYSLSTLIEAGIDEILIITGTEHMGGMVSLLGSGHEFNIRITYKVQDQAGGIAEALGLAENFCNNQPMLVLLGDNIFEDNLADVKAAFTAGGHRAAILLKEVDHPERFGVAELNDDGSVRHIIEKPSAPPSRLAVTGGYIYSPDVFEYIKTLKPSARGELEITDVNNWYLGQNQLDCHILRGFWTDAGTHPSLMRAHQLSLKLTERVASNLKIEIPSMHE